MRPVFVLCVLCLAACTPVHKKLPDAPHKVRKEHKKPGKRQGALLRVQVVETARALYGSARVVINSKAYRSDCSGLVCAVYEANGVQLLHSVEQTPRASSSQSIYLAATQQHRVYKKGTPRAGDLVFFRDTYDANRDGRVNDDVTHVGMVEAVEAGGTVVVLHFAGGKVKRARMNLAAPEMHKNVDGRVLNDFLRRRRTDDSKKVRYLAGELFVAYAAVVP